MSTNAVSDFLLAIATTSINLARKALLASDTFIFPAATLVASGVKGLFSASHFFLPPSSNLTFFTP